MNLDEIRKHMTARDRIALVMRPEEKDLIYMALADDVPDLVAEIERLYKVSSDQSKHNQERVDRWVETADKEREQKEAALLQNDELRKRYASMDLRCLELIAEKDVVNRLNGDLRKAAEIGAKNMKLWLQEGCACYDEHVCGVGRIQRELKTVESALTEKRSVSGQFWKCAHCGSRRMSTVLHDGFSHCLDCCNNTKVV